MSVHDHNIYLYICFPTQLCFYISTRDQALSTRVTLFHWDEVEHSNVDRRDSAATSSPFLLSV
jgi:hypothetical protein